MAKVRFAFGKNGLMVTLPDEYTYEVIESRTSSPVSNPVDTINDALEHPVTGRSLQELAKGKKSAAIALCDITRPVPNRVTLPLVLEKLHKAGIDVDGISIII